MKKVFKVLFLAVFGFLSFFLNNQEAFAYFVSSSSVSNEMTVAPLYTDTFIFNHEDPNGVVTELGREEKRFFENRTVTMDAPTGINLTGYELDSIKVNNSGSYNIGDTFTQLPSNMSIVYTYKSEEYTITYSGDTTNYTHSNTSTTTYYNQSYTTTITPVTGREIDTISVTMAGNDITSMYNTSTNTLTINQVTGNIVINVTTKVKEYSISYSGNNFSHENNATSVNHGDSFETTITASLLYEIDSVTVEMGGVNITSTAYNNNQISINNVTGNIQITVQTSFQNCLVEGTKVTLYDGSTKNIEDIRYNDLIKVWNHDLGKYGYEYAGWIEQEGKASSYTKVTFEDGTELKVVGGHSVFSKRLNKYVDVTSDELQIGDEVVTLRNGIGYVKITNIEKINEEVKFYHVITTRYFNLIANNILTTFEIYTNISNYKGFDSNNLRWLIQDEVEANMLTYEEFSEFGKYLFKVFRLGEARYIVEHGVATQAELNDLFYNYISSTNKTLSRNKDGNGNYMSMVTTSDDTNKNDTSHLVVEGTIYTVPTPQEQNGFAYWYNHSDNKRYQPGDTLEVDSGIYLEAIYE